MARINVSDLLVDPDFTDMMVVINRVPSVNSLGENVLIENTKAAVGSIQPATGKTLQRLPEALRLADVSSFWFKGVIVASAPGQYSAVLAFKGKRYQVQTVLDYSNWGLGWTEGTCVAEKPS